jgi:hypothetical protein
MSNSIGSADILTLTGSGSTLYGEADFMSNSQGGRDTLTATAVIINPF